VSSIEKEKGNRMLHVTIEDTGIGISESHLKLIFDEFRQASEGQNRSFEGTGLGLTIARKMIQLLGGEISVNSRIGKGSAFCISLPYPEVQLNAEPAITSSKAYISKHESREKILPKMTLLLVEDNEVNSQLIFAYLRSDYDIDWAADSTAAIEMAQQKNYDAILMDINLGPGMDGLQATQEIRKIKGYATLPIFALTGYTMFGDRDRLIEGGCTDYIPKPFTKSDILELLGKILKA